MNSALQRFTLRFINAKNVIRQIRNDEWIPRWNEHCDAHLTAFRGEYRLWLGNGASFCEVTFQDKDSEPGAFGLIWRHWVWWAAARKLKSDADRKKQSMREIPKL